MRDYFSRFGEIESLYKVGNDFTKKCKGFGYVTFKSELSFASALSEPFIKIDGTELTLRHYISHGKRNWQRQQIYQDSNPKHSASNLNLPLKKVQFKSPCLHININLRNGYLMNTITKSNQSQHSIINNGLVDSSKLNPRLKNINIQNQSCQLQHDSISGNRLTNKKLYLEPYQGKFECDSKLPISKRIQFETEKTRSQYRLNRSRFNRRLIDNRKDTLLDKLASVSKDSYP